MFRFSTGASKVDAVRAAAALAIAVIVAVALEDRVKEAEAIRDAWSPAGAVVVARRDLEAGHTIEESDVVSVPAPAGLKPPLALDSGVGRRLGRSVGRGFVLTSLDLAGEGTAPGIGRRWVAISVDKGTRPSLGVGDSVDLFGADPFGGTAELVTSGALIVEATDARIVVDIDIAEASGVAAAAVGVIVVVRAAS